MMFSIEQMSNKRKSGNLYFGAPESNKFERRSFCCRQFRRKIVVKKSRAFITLTVRMFISP